MAIKYYEGDEQFNSKELVDIHSTIFYPDNDEVVKVKFNTTQRLFIIAEEVSSIVKEVVRYLNQKGNLNISCLEYEMYKTEKYEFFISTERVEGFENISARSRGDVVPSVRWNEDIKLKM